MSPTRDAGRPGAPDPWSDLRAHTAARLALGRVGAGLPTAALLAFQLAHARARDAVHVALDDDALAADLDADAPTPPHPGTPGPTTVVVRSRAADRATYLLRPDLGRRLDAASAARLDAMRPAVRNGAMADGPDLVLVVADGLSSPAIARHAVPLVAAIRTGLPAGWTLGPVVVARQGRVALGDDVGQRLAARLVAVLIGERPGLSSPDSLGIYLTWQPRIGRQDAERNCISNVRPEGLAIADAAARFWWLCREAKRRSLTGISLKDGSATPTLPAASPPDRPPPIAG